MNRKTILAIVAGVAAIALIAIIAVAVNKKHQGTGTGDNPVVTDAPGKDGDSDGTIADKHSGPITIEDEMYPFTLIPNEDGTLTITMDGTVPEGFSWGEPVMFSDYYISVSRDTANTYTVTGKIMGSDSFDLQLARESGMNDVIAKIHLNVEVGKDAEYSEVGSMTEVIEGEVITIPILEADGESKTGISVLNYDLTKYDIPAEDESIIVSDTSNYYPFCIKSFENGAKYEISFDTDNAEWEVFNNNTKRMTVGEPVQKDSKLTVALNVLPNDEDYGDDGVIEGEEEIKKVFDVPDEPLETAKDLAKKPRQLIFGMANEKLNVYFELVIMADDDGTSTIFSYGTRMYRVPDLYEENYDEDNSDEGAVTD